MVRAMPSILLPMSLVDLHSSELRIVGRDNETILDLRPLQGLWTEEQWWGKAKTKRAVPRIKIGSFVYFDYSVYYETGGR